MTEEQAAEFAAVIWAALDAGVEPDDILDVTNQLIETWEPTP